MRFLLLLILGVLLAALGLHLGQKSFDNLQEARELQRYISPQIAGVLPGPAILQGKASNPEEQWSVEDSDQRCFYYSRVVERRESRDQGPYWAHVNSTTQVSPFFLEDATSAIAVAPHHELAVQARTVATTRLPGERRLRELCIAEGDDVTVLGVVRPDHRGGLEVHFDEDARFGAAMRTRRHHDEEMEASFGSFFFLNFALVLLAFAAWCLTSALRTPSFAVFVAGQSLVLLSALLWLGGTSTLQELRDEVSDVEDMLHATEAALTPIVGAETAALNWNAPWDSEAPASQELTETDLLRVQVLRTNAAEKVAQARRSRRRPTSFVISLVAGLPQLQHIALSPQEETLLRPPPQRRHRGLPLGAACTFGIVLFFFAPLGTLLGFRRIRQVRAAMTLPTSPVEAVSFGAAEVVGVAVEDPKFTPLRGPNGEPLIYLTDNAGGHRPKSRSYPAPSSGGKGKITASVPFYCEDPTGRILIDPTGADLISSRRSGRSRTALLQPGDPLYVTGAANVDPRTGQLFIGTGDDRSIPFFLSTFPERETRFRLSQAGTAWLALGLSTSTSLLLACLGVVLPFSPTLYFVAALSICAYLAILPPIFLYNDLVFLRRRVRRNAANIDVALKRRFDLLKNLEEVLRAALSHQEDLQSLLAQSRGMDVKMLREAHPELRSEPLVDELAAALSATEHNISLMRRGYHDAVELYNSTRGRFPHVLLATLLGFRPATHEKETND